MHFLVQLHIFCASLIFGSDATGRAFSLEFQLNIYVSHVLSVLESPVKSSMSTKETDGQLNPRVDQGKIVSGGVLKARHCHIISLGCHYHLIPQLL